MSSRPLTHAQIRRRGKRVWQRLRHAVQIVLACDGYIAAVDAVSAIRPSWNEFRCDEYVHTVLHRTPQRRLNMLARRVADHKRNGHSYRVWLGR